MTEEVLDPKLMAYVASKGYMVMASINKLPVGPLKSNDWEEDEMAEFPWAVIGDSSKAELEEQNRAWRYHRPIDSQFRFFYRVVVMD